MRTKFCQQLVYKTGYMKTHRQSRKERRKRRENRLVSLSLNTLSYNNKHSVLQKGVCFSKCFPVWSHKKYLVRKQNSLSERQKRFLIFSDIFCFHRKVFPVLALQEAFQKQRFCNLSPSVRGLRSRNFSFTRRLFCFCDSSFHRPFIHFLLFHSFLCIANKIRKMFLS